MQAVSRADWSNAAFPWLSVRECFVGIAPATVMAVSFSGEWAYEIHVPSASLYAAYTALRDAGASHGFKLFGALAVESMRLEKGYLHWKTDILTEFDPFEAGLQRFVKIDKPAFVDQAALAKRAGRGPRKKLVTLTLHAKDAPAHGGASAMDGSGIVGTVTSAGWGHRTNQNISYAFVDPDCAQPGQPLSVDVLGSPVAARVVKRGFYDPEMAQVSCCPNMRRIADFQAT
ncbi:glycine cleavage T C-terminal barrel domain-containing protein [uncultured Boseongicola sp.]|uniref:glycine cleavage T C-terminal barrel domain-containing protein n=1 Tax=uncultured Boseongicola sp. TaxID=1648499 RepID=UPI00342660E4